MAIGAAVAPKVVAKEAPLPSGYAEATFETEYLGNPLIFYGVDPSHGSDVVFFTTVRVEDGVAEIITIEKRPK